ncbi:hypothetical protein ASC90_20740 [Rhizobium sp. Root1220]|nr:hypothetical protein ASC90_20740 [Rhizobium sp. Root1220]
MTSSLLRLVRPVLHIPLAAVVGDEAVKHRNLVGTERLSPAPEGLKTLFFSSMLEGIVFLIMAERSDACERCDIEGLASASRTDHFRKAGFGQCVSFMVRCEGRRNFSKGPDGAPAFGGCRHFFRLPMFPIS